MNPESRFSLRGLSKPRDFYVFRASRIPIQSSRFEQTSRFLCFSGIQGLDKAFPFKWNTRVFNVFRCPGSWSGRCQLAIHCLIQKPLIWANSLAGAVNHPKSMNFHENAYKTLISLLLQIEGLSGLVVLEKPWFCCNGVPFGKKNNGFVVTGCNFRVQILQKSWFCWSVLQYSSLRGQIQEKRPKMPSSQ